MRTRIVVTGMGAVSALGVTAGENWASAVGGVAGIKPAEIASGEYGPPSVTVPIALIAPGFAAHYAKAIDQERVGALDPFAQYALAAAAEALAEAGLTTHASLAQRTAVVLGHGQGGLATLEASYQRFYGQRSPRLHPATIPKSMTSAAVSAVSMLFGIHGPVFAVSSACASSAHAVTQGAALIALGQADIAIVGGSEAISTPGCIRAWEAIGALSKAACRPFSAGRDGMALGEGGAVLVLESHDHAMARGATIIAELTGIGMSADAGHIIRPDVNGQIAAMRAAGEMAGILQRDDVLISAHGTGTVLNDRAESQAIREVFAHGATLPVIATKSSHGHVIGGSAALQAVLGISALRAQVAPPVLNFTGPDEACAVNVVTSERYGIRATALVQNAFAFGGLNVSLVFSV